MAVTAVEQVNRLRIRFASCSFHSSTGAAQSMKFFPKKRNQYSQLVTEL